ncbi:sodium:solute symporter family protein [Sulfurisphaera tokodaii]|uniref:SSS family transporter n=2 Tax=Sulfurisphaera tokodaii TaxID=111955 RepID=Q973Z2_SULTO|nr:sodium:solute symporter [Sulfurisphaera tokodaii]BAB65768.1 SSS family transporter [Sulfurisphaera tokodaii str. 7]HII72843.1 sodium:solute symporter [Sulfurisphaera tokodaii]
MNVDISTLTIFIVLFAIFAFLGFYGARWRRGDLSRLDEWGLGGRRLGILLVWFLMGADLYTAYTFIAVPELAFKSGALAYFAVFYVGLTFPIALLTMPRLWTVSRNRGYVTAADFIKDRFGSRALAIAVALVGAVAEIPYIALQIFGMQAVLIVMLIGLGLPPTRLTLDLSLLIAFIVLAAFTITSGLRGAALTGVFKDILVWITVLATIIAVPLSIGGFSTAFHAVKPIPYSYLPPSALSAFWTLAVGSALALYLYPHAINGSLSAEDKKKLKYGTALLPIYGVGLALLALFGILVFAIKPAYTLSAKYGGITAVPALLAYSMPSWFNGIAFLGIFIGGLVPAAIMAIGSANLLVRNVVKEFYNLTPKGEATLAKWISTAFKFLALAFIFVVPLSYAIGLQLLGGIIILQTLPPVFLGLFTNKLEGRSLLAGLIGGVASGVVLTAYVNHFGAIATTSYPTPLGGIYIALIALAINLVISLVGTAIAMAMGWKPKEVIKTEELVKTIEEK